MKTNTLRLTGFVLAWIVLAGILGCKASQPHTTATDPAAPANPGEPYQEVTVIIALSAVAPAGIVGHAGIAIDGQYYDFGPQRTDRFQRLKGFHSPAGPWWDDPEQQGKVDHQLDDVLARLGEEVHPEGSLVVIGTVAVTPEQAEQYDQYWQSLYDQMEQGQRTYSLLGPQCANMIAASLIQAEDAAEHRTAPPMPHRLRGMSPTRLYRFLHRKTRHSAGPRSGERIDFVCYRLSNGQLVPEQTLLNWSELGLTPPVRVKLGIVSLKHASEQALASVSPTASD